jgi:hypothetical protein
MAFEVARPAEPVEQRRTLSRQLSWRQPACLIPASGDPQMW